MQGQPFARNSNKVLFSHSELSNFIFTCHQLKMAGICYCHVGSAITILPPSLNCFTNLTPFLPTSLAKLLRGGVHDFPHGIVRIKLCPGVFESCHSPCPLSTGRRFKLVSPTGLVVIWPLLTRFDIFALFGRMLKRKVSNPHFNGFHQNIEQSKRISLAQRTGRYLSPMPNTLRSSKVTSPTSPTSKHTLAPVRGA